MLSGRMMLAFLKIYVVLTFSFQVSLGQEENTHGGCTYRNPFLASIFETIPQVPSGVQAIIPSYRFHCQGQLNQVLIQVMGESTRLDIQLWRPSGHRALYSLKWSATYVGNDSNAFYRVNQSLHNVSLLVCNQTISVSEGDVLGYYIERNNDPIRMGHSRSLSDPNAVFYSLENITTPLCSISLCDSDLKLIKHIAPSIIVDFVASDDSPTITDTTPLTCTKRVTNSCGDTDDPIDDYLPGNTTFPNPSSTSIPSPSLSPNPTPLSMSTPINTTLPRTTTKGGVSPYTQGMPVSSEKEVGDSMTNEAAGRLVVTIDSLVIGFIVVGAFLFVTLIFLVFVLIFCLCRKRRPPSKTHQRRLTDVESVDSRVTTSIHASSTEHSNSTTTVLPSQNRALASVTNGVAANGNGHVYANTDVTQEGNFRPFTPLYENGNKMSNGHSRSNSVGTAVNNEAAPNRRYAVKRPSRDRGWSTGALQDHRVNSVTSCQPLATNFQGPPRARSCSSKVSHLVSQPSLPAPAPVPPPRSRSNSETVDSVPLVETKSPKRVLNRYSAIETPSDYGNKELPKRLKSHSVHGSVVDRRAWKTVKEGEDYESHDYADPDYPSDEEHNCLLEPRYDRLIAHASPKPSYEDVDIYPEDIVDSTSPPPLPPKSTGNAIYQDPEKSTSSSRENIPIPAVYYGYVPTAEQRRLLQLHNGGHYEIADGVTSIDGYDHLSYFEEADTYWAPADTTTDLYEQLSANKYRELPRSQIKIMKRIGSGHFGTVSKGVWYCGEEPKEVAVKTVKTSTEQERIKLLQEAAIMGQFAHHNVVRLHGVVTVGEPVLIVLEYMTRGDLRSFLQKLHPRLSKREIPDVLPSLFIKFSKDIAGGMCYLSKKNFIHRDLAARNILLSQDLTCKIGDFGMARDIEGENEYYRSHGGIIPVKWTAPEALNYNKYSSASDVWSYGMVLFEIWSLGEKPFNDLTNPIVIALVSSKHCQPPPPGCPRPIYHLMVECWNPDHNRRPNFDSIHDYLDSPEESLLQWQHADVIPGKQAHMLGATLSEANDLYLDLQRTYQKPPQFSSKI